MPEEQDGPETDYTERLWPGPVVWILAAASIGALAVAYGTSLGAAIGWAVAASLGAVAVALIAWSAARIRVTPDQLRAGRATIGWEHTGRVLALDGDQSRMARGPQGDPSAFFLLRPGVGPGAVVVEVVDHEDPHATWLLASRHPQRLARAIEGARGRLSS